MKKIYNIFKLVFFLNILILTSPYSSNANDHHESKRRCSIACVVIGFFTLPLSLCCCCLPPFLIYKGFSELKNYDIDEIEMIIEGNDKNTVGFEIEYPI